LDEKIYLSQEEWTSKGDFQMIGLRFASDKFENINVVNIVKDDQENSTKWYILDD